MEGDYQILRNLHRFTEGTKTADVYLVQGKQRFLVLYYDAADDYNHADYFNDETKAEESAEDWVLNDR